MPQGFTANARSPAALQQGLGFVPRRQLTSGVGVTVDMDAGTIDVDLTALPVPSVTFGAGAPAGAAATGALYFDTTAAYVGYVGNGGTWHQF